MQAKGQKDRLNSELSSLQNQIKVKTQEVSTHQSTIDQIKTEHSSVLSSFEAAQKNFYSIGAEIARFEANLQNLTKAEVQAEEDLRTAKESLSLIHI